MCFVEALVMSQTFTLKGRSSCLTVDINPPIELDSRYSYSLALISLSTWNSIPNIESGRNKFYYYYASGKDDEQERVIEIPTGSYEIADIESYLQKQLAANSGGGGAATSGDNLLSLKSNNNTLKCELKSVYDIDFEPQDSIGQLLGFSPLILDANTLHESDIPVEIIQVTTIRIECNIISGSYYTNNPSHTLYEFTPTVDPGYSIIIEPRNLIYLPVNRASIDNITISILDQEARPVNFRGEEIVVKLELKKHGFSF